MKALVFPVAMTLFSAAAGAAPITQNFESFNLGSPTQNGWLTAGSATVSESIVDSGIGRFGDRTLYMDGTMVGASGPFFGAALGNRTPTASQHFGVIAMDLIIGSGGALVEFVGSDAFIATRVWFEADGGISVLDSNLTETSLSATWDSDAIFRLGYELVDASTDAYNLYLDGVLIHSGETYSQTGYSYAQFGLWNGQFNSTASTFSSLWVDNLSDSIVIPLPTPVGLASAGLIGVLGLRRRRP